MQTQKSLESARRRLIGFRPLIRSHGQSCFQITLRSHCARPLTNHVQQVLAKTLLPEGVTVVFDMEALNFS